MSQQVFNPSAVKGAKRYAILSVLLVVIAVPLFAGMLVLAAAWYCMAVDLFVLIVVCPLLIGWRVARASIQDALVQNMQISLRSALLCAGASVALVVGIPLILITLLILVSAVDYAVRYGLPLGVLANQLAFPGVLLIPIGVAALGGALYFWIGEWRRINPDLPKEIENTLAR